MILYTPLPVEEVLRDVREKEIARSYVTHQGRTFYVDEHPNGELMLSQLLSTDPNDYLNKNYEPGTPLR